MKKSFFPQNRNEENGKLFCKQSNKCVKLFLSKKNYFPEGINLTEEENNSLLTNYEEVAKELNTFFANTVKRLNILNYENCNSLAENIDDDTLNVIAKRRNHTSILAIASEHKNRANFFFQK